MAVIKANDVIDRVLQVTPKNVPIRGIIGALNRTVDEIHRHRYGWEFYQKDGRIVTSTPFSTGTVTVTSGSTAVVGTSATLNVGCIGRKFRIGDGPVYVVTAVNVNLRDFTISEAYTGSTASGQSFQIYQDVYALGSDVFRLLRMWDETNNRTMNPVSPLRMKGDDVFSEVSGDAINYCNWRSEYLSTQTPNQTDTSKYIKIWPVPSSATVLRYWYYRKPTLVNAIGDTVDIPAQTEWLELVTQGVVWQIEKQLRDKMWQEDRGQFVEMLERLYKDDNPITDFKVAVGVAFEGSGAFVLDNGHRPTMTGLY